MAHFGSVVLLAAGGLGLLLALLAGLYTIWLIGYLTARLRALQVEVDGLRIERAKLVGQIADLEQKLQITLIENAMLSAKRDASENSIS